MFIEVPNKVRPLIAVPHQSPFNAMVVGRVMASRFYFMLFSYVL